MKTKLTLLCLGIITLISCNNKSKKMEMELQSFIKKHEETSHKLSVQANIAFWNASVTGDEKYYAEAEELQKQLIAIYNDKEKFEVIKRIKESGLIKNDTLKRHTEILYLKYISALIDREKLNEIVALEMQIEKKYSSFRANIKGKEYSDNDIEKILKTSTNSEELKEAWEAHKTIGNNVSDDIKLIVNKRNGIAKDLGYSNYHEMSLKMGEQDLAAIDTIFAELEKQTRGIFIQLKSEIDIYLAQRLGIKQEELMPWHYQNRFFQEAPDIYPVDLDIYYKSKNLETLTSDYFSGIGLAVDDIIARSDLYEKPGKNQHAFCFDLDQHGDIRILCNIKDNSYWMGTMLHEFGHGVYDKFINPNLPMDLRHPAHTFTTEAIAMLFGRLSSNPQWIQDNLGINDTTKNNIKEDCYKSLKLEQLVFSRWVQVMYHFEKEMYANPDQDLDSLWWSKVETYQMIKKPAGRNQPDWASKIHIATAPCYYHNYLLGEILASQLYFHICEKVLNTDPSKAQSFNNAKAVGDYLKNNIFEPGSLYPWNEMIKKATGENLNPVYYAKQFIH